MIRPNLISVLPFAVTLLAATLSTTAVADSAKQGVPYKFESHVSGDAFSYSSSMFIINIASGMRNSQAGANALAINPQGSSTAEVSIAQTRAGNLKVDVPFAYSGITGNALRFIKGIVLMNQVSGVDNAQANAVAIAVGMKATAVANTQLSATSSDGSQASADTEGTEGTRQVSLADTALRGARGVVLINQTAGLRNLSTNRFSLQMRTGGAR